MVQSQFAVESGRQEIRIQVRVQTSCGALHTEYIKWCEEIAALNYKRFVYEQLFYEHKNYKTI